MRGINRVLLPILFVCGLSYGFPIQDLKNLKKPIQEPMEKLERIYKKIREPELQVEFFEEIPESLIDIDKDKDINNLMQRIREEERSRESQTITQTDSCENMVYKSPKTMLVDESGKKILEVGLLGFISGALLSKDRGAGAIIGGIEGAFDATIEKIHKTPDLQIEDRKSTAKRLGHSKGALLKAEVKIPQMDYKKGQYITTVLRVSLLTDGESQVEPISVTAYMLSGDTKIPMGKEEYYVELGTTPLVYQFPVCREIKPGKYKIIFEVVGVGQHVSAEGTFRVVQ